MKIYFAGSIRGGREDVETYLKIIEYLKKFGEVLTEHIGDKNLTSKGEIHLDNKEIHNRDLAWVKEADVIIAEVSTPSLGVGYEIGRAIENKKRVLCLYHPQEGKRLSAMIAGCPNILVRNYNNLEEVKKILDEFFNKL